MHRMSDLEEAAQQYYAAMRGEMILDQSQHDAIKENGKTTLINLVPFGLTQLQWLAEHADSETVRWSATKYILDNGLYGKSPDEDELDRLIRSMRPTTPTPTT